jgi:hypothetical protein
VNDRSSTANVGPHRFGQVAYFDQELDGAKNPTPNPSAADGRNRVAVRGLPTLTDFRPQVVITLVPRRTVDPWLGMGHGVAP